HDAHRLRALRAPWWTPPRVRLRRLARARPPLRRPGGLHRQDRSPARRRRRASPSLDGPRRRPPRPPRPLDAPLPPSGNPQALNRTARWGRPAWPRPRHGGRLSTGRHPRPRPETKSRVGYLHGGVTLSPTLPLPDRQRITLPRPSALPVIVLASIVLSS